MASTNFDRHYEGVALLDEVPSGVDTKGFDYHYEGKALTGEAPAGNPWYYRAQQEAFRSCG